MYNKGYYLADGIYMQWSLFVKTIPAPSTEKQYHFAKCQEACWKDVEWTFRVRHQRFANVRYPALTWSKSQMWEYMNYCVTIHNMIIKCEREKHVKDD
jgi:hypothetical protein